jgi:cation transport ATPase
MFAGSLLVGFTVIMVAVWLEYSDSITAAYWVNHAAKQRLNRDNATESSDDRYRHTRRRWRLVIHGLLAFCGVLMIAAGWAGPGRFWIAAWTAVAMLMLCILVLALGDAVRTQAHQIRKLAENRSDLKEKLSGK